MSGANPSTPWEASSPVGDELDVGDMADESTVVEKSEFKAWKSFCRFLELIS